MTGSSKSLIAGIKFLFRIIDSPMKQFFLCGESVPSLERNIIRNPMGIVELFPEICSYKSSGRGGARIEVKTNKGIKEIYLAGYTQADKWKKILGSTTGGFFVDEINIASEDFIGELFTRLARDKSFLIATSNGDDDELMVYQRYLNKCIPHPDYMDNIPASTLRDLNNADEKEEGYIYYFFSFEDNPTYTAEDVRALESVHPPGTWQHKTKILGERGTLEGAVYADFIKPRHSVSHEKVMSQSNQIEHLEVGVDMGKSAETIFTISAYTHDWARLIVLDSYKLEGTPDSEGIAKQLNDWLLPYWKIFGRRITVISVDDSMEFLIRTIRNNMAFPIDVKYSRKPEISDRIILMIQMLYKDRLLFTDSPGAQESRKMLLKVKRDGKGGYIEEDKPWNDYQDSLFYTFTRNMSKLTKYDTLKYQKRSNY